MAIEIEHKYLVRNDSFKSIAIRKSVISQGYLCREPNHTVRVRIANNKGFLTIKGITQGSSRCEFEYEIPIEDAKKMIRMCEGRIIEKTRYIIPYGGFIWEVDEFHNRADSLVIAEIELPSEQTTYELPPFVGENVTGKVEYYNSNL